MDVFGRLFCKMMHPGLVSLHSPGGGETPLITD